MDYIHRVLEQPISETLARGKSVLLLGSRQTGKTTLIAHLPSDTTISLVQPAIRQRYEKNPGLLTGEIEVLAENKRQKPLVVIDEVQKVPELLDAAQDLIDRNIAQFILTGSSARKLKTLHKMNWLPGRVVPFVLSPLTFSELPSQHQKLDELLTYGSLPGITALTQPHHKEMDLAAYVTTYLEEEVRAEALVRNVGAFSRFLELAASESGNILNFAKLSQEIGVAHTTIAAYYQILEDCLIIERIPPFLKTKTRRKLIKSQKYVFFDLGVRRLCAGEGVPFPLQYKGRVFEQWVGLELIRQARLSPDRTKIYFWRDASGPEVDWIVESNGQMVPIEVKLTDNPTLDDAKHLKTFIHEYENVGNAYMVCTVPRKLKLAERIMAIPWQELSILRAGIN